VVVVGDLNITPWSHAFRSLERAGLRNSQRGFGLQATWPAGYGPFMVPIDHALHSRDLTVTHREVGPAHGSSHRSVLVELAPARPRPPRPAAAGAWQVAARQDPGRTWAAPSVLDGAGGGRRADRPRAPGQGLGVLADGRAGAAALRWRRTGRC
jgi:hypothetical protein